AEAAQVARAREDRYVVEVGADTGRPALDVLLQAGLERLLGRQLALVGEPRLWQAELARAVRESRRQRRDRPPPRLYPRPAQLRAQLLGRAQVGAVQPRPLLPADQHLALRGRRAAAAVQRHAGRLLAEPDQLRLVARPRREALRAHVQRLEQVRLANAVLADD